MRDNLILASVCALSLALAGAAPAVDFQADVRPILAKRCVACHGPDERSRQANFRIDGREDAIGAKGGYAGIVPGSSAKSRVVARITDPQRPMPPIGPRLTSEEVSAIRQWIDEGAPYSSHWSFEPPRRPAPPNVRDGAWPRNPIDSFVLARLEREGLKPSLEADRYTLARRVALDLTGLPPEPALVEKFVHDRSPNAYESLVDQMLASPHFGERWARVWLDLARYADTQGYERDPRRTIWPYRDWVIRALNDNMPFDRFTLLQLAGDLLPSPTQDDLIATGFHRNTMTNTEAGTDDEEFRDAAVKDRVATTGQVWMGLTFGCAQCHTHKYDPISHQEYYQIYAFFNQTEDSDKPDDRPVLNLGDGSTLIMRELPNDRRRTTRILQRGNFLDPGATVEPGVLSAFHPLPAGAPRNRIGLAQWLTDEKNPLTARVTVNRLWARLFGVGLVETEEDFGTQGAHPSHPELLDWLATEFVRMKWDTKAILKTILMSATYRQSSDLTPALLAKDPRNRLLARGARFRLEAEMVHDQALAASGLLSPKMFGPPVMPWQPDGIWSVVYNADRWATSANEDRNRRALYTFLRRTSPYPSLTTFDAPSGDLCTMRRIRTNTPLQALVSLNDPVLMVAAQRLALRTLSEAKASDAARADYMFRLLLMRPPQRAELERIVALRRKASAELSKSNDSTSKLLQYDRIIYPDDREVTLVADARANPPQWSYTFEDPGEGWRNPDFDTSRWLSGKGRFGASGRLPRNTTIGTAWDREKLWLRIRFDAPKDVTNLSLRVLSTCSFEAYLNGVLAESTDVDRGAYYDYGVSADAMQSLRPVGNVLAVQVTRLLDRSQLFDMGLLGTLPLRFEKQVAGDANRAAWVVVANALLNLDETVTRR